MNWLETIFRLRRSPSSEEEEKPFLEHLEDLRWMLIKMAIALTVCMVAGFVFRGPIAEVIQQPFDQVTEQARERHPGEGTSQLASLNPVDSVNISFKLAFYAGLVLSFPLQLYYLAHFLLPGLTDRERAMLIPVLMLGTGLFITGVLFSYFTVLPITLVFFEMDQQRMGWNAQWSVSDYYSFVTQFSIGFGLAFELPLVVMLLVKLGIIDYYMMSATRSHAIVIMVLVSAVITPTTDVITLLCMALPLIVLYEVCIWISYFIMKKREKPEVEGP